MENAGERRGGVQVTILNKIVIGFVEKLTFKQRSKGIGELACGYLEKRLSMQRGQPEQRPSGRGRRPAQLKAEDSRGRIVGDEVTEGMGPGPMVTKGFIGHCKDSNFYSE